MRSRLRHDRRPHGAALWPCAALVLALAPCARAADPEVEQLRGQLEATQQELSTTQQKLEKTQGNVEDLRRKVDALESAPPVEPAPPPAAQTARIPPVNADNPAISFVVDTTLAADTRSSWGSIGYPDGAEFKLKNGELFVSAPIDPFLRGYASINGTSDQRFDIEEAAIVTTALPWGLTAKGGRFFADLGRLPHWHDEGLPFVDRPPSIDRLIGGESGAEGLELSWLAPTDQYIELVGGVYNAVGSENLDALNENGFFGRHTFDQLNYLGRLHTYVDLTDTLNLELGASLVAVPKYSDRYLWGGDVTLRHQPGTSGVYQGFVWGTEWYWNDQRFVDRNPFGVVTGEMRTHRQGGYSYVEAFLTRSYSLGGRFDFSESPEGTRDRAFTGSAFVSWKPSEFQRLRFQFDDTWGDQPNNQRFTLQWTAFIGSHSHGFAQR